MAYAGAAPEQTAQTMREVSKWLHAEGCAGDVAGDCQLRPADV